MRSSTFILFFLIFFGCDNPNKKVLDIQNSDTKKENQTKKPELSLAASIDSVFTRNGDTYIAVSTELTNNTDSIVRYLMWSCSSSESYTIDMKGLDVYPVECDKNYPKVYNLWPNEKMKKAVELTTPNSVESIKNKKFRIGFRDVTIYKQEEAYLKFKEIGTTKEIIWSDSLTIN
jgi:hypothetical protein